jgi:glutathione peroxidase
MRKTATPSFIHVSSITAAVATAAALLAPGAGCKADADSAAAPTAISASETKGKTSVYQFTQKSLDGKTIDLSQYKGKVVLIVNTASKCGFTPQYKALEGLHEKFAPQGLAVLGFPANEFGGQEPGTDPEIGAFCQKNYGVTFDMFSKVVVKGAGKVPLFKYLTEEANPELTGEIGWNFEKFLISRDGRLVARFKSAVKPDAPELVAAIQAELAKK